MMTSKPKTNQTNIPKKRNNHASYLISLFDNISDGLIATDLEFNILEWNAAAEAMYGWTDGYPRDLKGEEIPPAARIFTVADVCDALTSDRPYRGAWSRSQALKHIEEQSGKQFDSQAVRAFQNLIKE
ncbi:MAG TPA: HD domain-containing phosphohydrolase [Anaerolineales bacterium]|nr:HD domain-containing phosphohydrolase [Anaerolineales bacterium]